MLDRVEPTALAFHTHPEVLCLLSAGGNENHLRGVVRERRKVESAVQRGNFKSRARQQVFQFKAEEIAHGEGLDDGTPIKIIDQLTVGALLGVSLSQNAECPAQVASIWKSQLGSVFSLFRVDRGRK